MSVYIDQNGDLVGCYHSVRLFRVNFSYFSYMSLSICQLSLIISSIQSLSRMSLSHVIYLHYGFCTNFVLDKSKKKNTWRGALPVCPSLSQYHKCTEVAKGSTWEPQDHTNPGSRSRDQGFRHPRGPAQRRLHGSGLSGLWMAWS